MTTAMNGFLISLYAAWKQCDVNWNFCEKWLRHCDGWISQICWFYSSKKARRTNFL